MINPERPFDPPPAIPVIEALVEIGEWGLPAPETRAAHLFRHDEFSAVCGFQPRGAIVPKNATRQVCPACRRAAGWDAPPLNPLAIPARETAA